MKKRDQLGIRATTEIEILKLVFIGVCVGTEVNEHIV